MVSKRRRMTVALLFAAAIGAANAGTKVESTVTPKGSVTRAKKVLVFLVSPDADRRSGWEEILTGEMQLKGAQATPSYRLFPELPKDKESAVAKIAADGFDAVLVARLVGTTSKVKFHEEDVSLQPEYMGNWWGAYTFTYDQVYLPGYAENKSRATIKVDMWKLDGDKSQLVWSGTSDSIDPRIDPAKGREVIVAVTKTLRKKGLI